ncbi:LOW QUALITY PROTEIN: hypothetical protein PoB_001859400 [Plakobranchus ocellatus]|uniref:Uncharacterized protein n=1 Tax=Plakobranchus ocellatus TaxID=259542 RepID=A0AAV3ZCI9_9GAST|nr:LOW QUALITY PROTEIN: hypothetical protein PoB_001859400 [Plakobranchus ocellatus]
MAAKPTQRRIMLAKPTQWTQHASKTYSAEKTCWQNPLNVDNMPAKPTQRLSGDNMLAKPTQRRQHTSKTYSAEKTCQQNLLSGDNMLAKPTQRRQHASKTYSAETTC